MKMILASKESKEIMYGIHRGLLISLIITSAQILKKIGTISKASSLNNLCSKIFRSNTTWTSFNSPLICFKLPTMLISRAKSTFKRPNTKRMTLTLNRNAKESKKSSKSKKNAIKKNIKSANT
jgi:hypothetical protein